MARRIPSDSWDSHMHVVDPLHYPLAPDAEYVPSSHTLSDALTFESTLGFRNIVMVQPSIYDNDNSCLLDALQSLGPQRGRGVVAFDPNTVTTQTLKTWHGMGVRGVRLNLKSTGRTMEPSVFEGVLRKYAERISPFGWVLQLYVSMDMVASLERIVPELGVKVCLDHFADPSLPSSPSPYDPYDLPGFRSLVSLLRQGSTYVKVSAPYRLSSDPELRDLQPLAEELLRVAGSSRLVFSTDWPHTRFEGLDIAPFVEKVFEWCKGDEGLIERVFRGNAEDLWDVAKHTKLRRLKVTKIMFDWTSRSASNAGWRASCLSAWGCASNISRIPSSEANSHRSTGCTSGSLQESIMKEQLFT